MKAEIISVGSELTSGQNLDTNSQWLSRRLAEIGIPVGWHTTVADDLDANLDVFRTAVGRADLLLATGGLGPTQDDLTRDVLAQVADISEQQALAALDEVLHGSLLREASGTYQFAHDKIREVAYSEAGAARRRVFHRRALEVLKREGAALAELAHHALAASIDEPAFELSVAAGDAALRVLAAREALEHYARARAIAERRGWTKHLADLHVRFGKAFSSLAQWAEERRELNTWT